MIVLYIYKYIYSNDIENKKIKKLFVILSVFYHLQSMIYVENL